MLFSFPLKEKDDIYQSHEFHGHEQVVRGPSTAVSWFVFTGFVFPEGCMQMMMT